MTLHTIKIQIAYAVADNAWLKTMNIGRGATPVDVIQKSGLLDEFKELVIDDLNYGVFSKRVDHNYLMNDGDRLEIYRPLTADPKTVRRELAKAGKTMSGER